MDTTSLTQYIADLLDKIYYLAEASQKRCQVLSNVEDIVIKCKRTLKLCSRIQKNCSYFENDLIQEAVKYNIVLKNEEIDSSGFVSDISFDNGKKKTVENSNVDSTEDKEDGRIDCGLTISLKFGDIVKTKNISKVNDIDANKFWMDLMKFTENYLSFRGNEQTQGESSLSTSVQTEPITKYVSGCEDPVLLQIKEIFGSDSEMDPSKSDDNNDEISSSISNNQKSKNIEKISNKNCEGEHSTNNPLIQKDILANRESTYNPLRIQDKQEERLENAEKQKNLLEENVGDTLDEQTYTENDKKITEENVDKSDKEAVRDSKMSEESLREKSNQQTEPENDKEVVEKNVDNKICEQTEAEKCRGMIEKKKQETSTQSTSHHKLHEIVENEITAETEKEKKNGNGVGEPFSISQTIGELGIIQISQSSDDFQISASLEKDFASILNEEFHNNESPQELPSHKDQISQKENSCDLSEKVDAVLTTAELAQAVDSELISGKDVVVPEPRENSSNALEDPPGLPLASTSQTMRNVLEASISRNIDDENSVLDNVEDAPCIDKEATDDLEETQKTNSSNIEEDVEGTTQIISPVNIGREEEDVIQAASSGNVEVDDEVGHSQSTLTAISENEATETEAEVDLEATQIIPAENIQEKDSGSDNPDASKETISDTQPTTDFPSSNKSGNIKESDSPRKKKFLSVLGLTKLNICDQLMTVNEESNEVASEAVHIEKDSESAKELGEFADKAVKDALEYFNELDSSSESCSVQSFRTGSLFSDSDESIISQSEKTSAIVNNKKLNFVPKDCVVNIERLDINNLGKKSIAGANTSSSEDFLKKKFFIKDCFVRLEYPRVLRVSSDSDDEITSSNDDGEVDKLCDLSSLGRKRKKLEGSSDSEKRKKGRLSRIKRRRKVNLSGSDTSDLTGFSSVSDDEIAEQKGGIFGEEIGVETVSTALDPNELLTEIVCHTIHASGSSSSDYNSDEEIKSTKSRKKTGPTKDKKEASKEGSWRDDPLLKGSLALPSETKTVNSNVHKRIRKNRRDSNESDSAGRVKKAKKSKQLDPSWRSDEDSSSSSGEEFEPKPYIDYMLRTKMKSLLSDDSDVEVVDGAGTPLKSSIISLDSDEERDKKPDKNGRRNILSVLSSGELTRETQKAAKEEEERVIKLQMRDQMRTSQSQASTEDSLVLDTSSDGYNLTVDPVLTKRLFPHQVDGVKFMWDACYLSLDSLETFEGTGCILAHNMGLGKTFQVFTLVHTLFSHSITNTNNVLIVCPLSTVSGWSKEFKSGVKMSSNKTHINIISIQSSHDSDSKFANINRWKQKGGVLIIGYEAFQKMTIPKKNNIKSEFLRKALVNPGPDLVVCDEGHLLKNGKALRTKALMEIRTKRRIVLTGTPLQNNLTEYYYMVQFVKPNLLGTRHEFIRQFVNPIMNGQYEDSDEADITLMKKRTHVLHRILKNTVQRYEATELQQYIGDMKDYALFIQLHPVQKELYEQYIEMAKARKDPKNVKPFKYFFNDYQLSKYICSHPQLLHTMETQSAQGKRKVIKEMDTIGEEPEVQEVEGIPDDWWKSKCSDEVKTNIEFGTKLQVMMGIIEEAEKIEEKVLIFTSSLVELSSVEYFLKLKGTPRCPSWRPRSDYFRLDGTVPPSVRTQMCDIFNDVKNKKLRLFLMSHKVGGLGLNLVAASRVILLGANFNPSYDTQSIFRAYRFGQEKTVYIYRLLSMGTMEEKIYHRCVTKLAIASRVVDKHQIARHYKNLDLEDLYTVAVDLSLERTIPTKPDDNLLSNILLKFECIHKYHQHQKLLENRPNEDLNEEDKLKAWEEFKQMTVPNQNKPVNNSNPNAIFIPNKDPSIISDIVQSKWLQLNQPNVSRVVDVVDPLANSSDSHMNPTGSELAEGIHFMVSKKLVPNPLNLRVDEETRSKNVDMQNVDNSPAVVHPGETRKKTGNMCPNPFVFGKARNVKKNASTKNGITPFRKSSSDDFQKPTGLKIPRSNITFRRNQTPRASTARSSSSANNVSRNLREVNVSSQNTRPSSSSLIAVDEDDDVIVVGDSPEKKSLPNGRMEKSVQDAIHKLNMNKISVSYGNQKTEKKNFKDDEFVIEIL